ncbi:MAG: hypothetical protein JF612_01515, partial [Planctomycetia bacterium]|nr:hypothetical protein [Planctomycetia bacterium]
RELDLSLVADLPPGVDPCGENGEYHSFVSDGPIFNYPVEFRTGVTVCRENRHYIDLLPSQTTEIGIAAEAIPPV